MAKYNVYPGEFPCHTCKEIVLSIRSYGSDRLLTWMCSNKHVSEVSLSTKKSRADHDRKE